MRRGGEEGNVSEEKLKGAARRATGQHSPADLVARLEQEDALPEELRQLLRGPEARDAAADDDRVEGLAVSGDGGRCCRGRHFPRRE